MADNIIYIDKYEELYPNDYILNPISSKEHIIIENNIVENNSILSMNDYKKQISKLYGERDAVNLSLKMLKQYTIIRQTLREISYIYIPDVIISIIIDIIKDDPQEILEISVYECMYILDEYTKDELLEFVNEGWDLNKLGKYPNDSSCLTTPLISASEWRNIDLMKFYLEHGANPDIIDSAGYNALTTVLLGHNIWYISRPEKAKKCVDLLRKYNVKFEITEYHEEFTPEYLKDYGIGENVVAPVP